MFYIIVAGRVSLACFLYCYFDVFSGLLKPRIPEKTVSGDV